MSTVGSLSFLSSNLPSIDEPTHKQWWAWCVYLCRLSFLLHLKTKFIYFVLFFLYFYCLCAQHSYVIRLKMMLFNSTFNVLSSVFCSKPSKPNILSLMFIFMSCQLLYGPRSEKEVEKVFVLGKYSKNVQIDELGTAKVTANEKIKQNTIKTTI